MRKEAIKERLYLLFLVLQYASEKTAMLTTGERIMINQERAQLFHELDYPLIPARPVSEEIEQKIKKIDQLIQIYNWQPINQDPFYDEY